VPNEAVPVLAQAYDQNMKKLPIAALAFAAISVVALGAQTSETTTKTKVDVKDGKDVKVTGCVEAGSNGGYVLNDVSSKHEDLHQYILVSDDDFSKVLGQRVEIEGTLADRKDGKVEIKTETKAEGAAKDTHAKIEGKGPYLGVKHMKRVSGTCS
jgi:acylphosphatase